MTYRPKVINDPVYGIISIDNKLIFDIMGHPLLQRQRRIMQLGFSYLVYPGATHNRFQHVVGATYLMQQAIDELKAKGLRLNSDDRDAAMVAILCHDLGHGPFSHTLEDCFFSGISHEQISGEFMRIINRDMGGDLAGGIQVFDNTHELKILHRLVSSQLDMDRLDYLTRDSYFTGVNEGVISSDRIIKMLNYHGDEPVIEHKGIYSVEKFLIARRLMYWQVYLHKTVVVAEEMLKKIISRARKLARQGVDLFAPPQLKFFLLNDISMDRLHEDFEGVGPLEYFADLDDSDIISAIKVWKNCGDYVLSRLCSQLIDRKLFKIEIYSDEIPPERIEAIRQGVIRDSGIPADCVDDFVISGTLYNKAYSRNRDEKINILMKDGQVKGIGSISDISIVSALSKTVKKYFVCYVR